jgi:hypothetical protein
MLARQTSAKLKRGEAFEPRLPQKAGLRNRLSVPPNYFPFAFIPDVLAASTLGIATPDWRKHAADLEAEMLRRGMIFDEIDWSEALFSAERAAWIRLCSSP